MLTSITRNLLWAWMQYSAPLYANALGLQCKNVSNQSISLSVQECIVPRCIFSVEDALFCAQMLYRMALLDPPHFQFPHALQAVFNEVSVLLRSCTQQETMNLSFFFKQVRYQMLILPSPLGVSRPSSSHLTPYLMPNPSHVLRRCSC